MTTAQYGDMTGFLEPEPAGGPSGLPSLDPPIVASPRAAAFLAPPLFNGLPYLAAPIVFVLPAPVYGGGGRGRPLRASSRSMSASVKSSSPAPYTRYHGRSDEQLEKQQAALLDDEEIILTFLMEIARV